MAQLFEGLSQQEAEEIVERNQTLWNSSDEEESFRDMDHEKLQKKLALLGNDEKTVAEFFEIQRKKQDDKQHTDITLVEGENNTFEDPYAKMDHDEVKAHAKIAKDYTRLMKTARKPVQALRMYLASVKDDSNLTLEEQDRIAAHMFEDESSKFSVGQAETEEKVNPLVERIHQKIIETNPGLAVMMKLRRPGESKQDYERRMRDTESNEMPRDASGNIDYGRVEQSDPAFFFRDHLEQMEKDKDFDADGSVLEGYFAEYLDMRDEMQIDALSQDHVVERAEPGDYISSDEEGAIDDKKMLTRFWKSIDANVMFYTKRQLHNLNRENHMQEYFLDNEHNMLNEMRIRRAHELGNE
jgi:hypothetical protein